MIILIFSVLLAALLGLWWLPPIIWKNNDRARKIAGYCLFWVNIPFYFFMIAPAYFKQPVIQNKAIASAIHWTGLVLIIYGTIFTIFMVRFKLKAGGPGYDPKKLVKEGPFSIVRHPQVSSAFILSLGFSFWEIGVYHLILNIPYFLILMFHLYLEERLLLIPAFGEDYYEYKKTTKSFIPFIF